MNTIETKTAPRPSQRRLAFGLGVAVLAAVVAGGAYALLNDDAAEAIVGGEPLGGAGADCLEYREAMLLGQEFAFDGTLEATSADGAEATFAVHEWYRGGEGAEITLGAGGLLGEDAAALIGTSFELGRRYLISGSGGLVWACGYSLTYDTGIAGQWAQLFGA